MTIHVWARTKAQTTLPVHLQNAENILSAHLLHSDNLQGG